MFNPGPDKWDLDTSSLVLQLMHGFHGVNGTAAVSLTEVTCREHQQRFHAFRGIIDDATLSVLRTALGVESSDFQ